jgi:hypothetical protein
VKQESLFAEVENCCEKESGAVASEKTPEKCWRNAWRARLKLK